MKLIEVYEYINSFAPFATQADFDNAGFLVGDREAELTGGVVALDVTSGAIEYAKSIGANLIVSHHPVIFDPLREVTAHSLVYKLIESGISVISAHTNLDRADGGINDVLCELLELQNVKGVLPDGEVFEARVGELPTELTPDEFGNLLTACFPQTAIKYVAGDRNVNRVGVCSGAGGSLLIGMIAEGVDAFVTADVKHNVFLEAAESGLSLYDCGHYSTEDIIVSPLTEKLNRKFGGFSEYHSDLIKSVISEE